MRKKEDSGAIEENYASMATLQVKMKGYDIRNCD